MIKATLRNVATGETVLVKAVCTEETGFSPVWADGDGRTYGRVLDPDPGYRIELPWEVSHGN